MKNRPKWAYGLEEQSDFERKYCERECSLDGGFVGNQIGSGLIPGFNKASVVLVDPFQAKEAIYRGHPLRDKVPQSTPENKGSPYPSIDWQKFAPAKDEKPAGGPGFSIVPDPGNMRGGMAFVIEGFESVAIPCRGVAPGRYSVDLADVLDPADAAKLWDFDDQFNRFSELIRKHSPRGVERERKLLVRQQVEGVGSDSVGELEQRIVKIASTPLPDASQESCELVLSECRQRQADLVSESYPLFENLNWEMMAELVGFARKTLEGLEEWALLSGTSFQAAVPTIAAMVQLDRLQDDFINYVASPRLGMAVVNPLRFFTRAGLQLPAEWREQQISA